MITVAVIIAKALNENLYKGTDCYWYSFIADIVLINIIGNILIKVLTATI